MLNKEFSDWLVSCSENADFINTTNQTETAIRSQAGVELVLRFLAFRNVPYTAGLDVHEYLDKALFKLTAPNATDIEIETNIFTRTFSLLNAALGDRAFKRWSGHEFKGKFLMSVYEVMAMGVSMNIDAIETLDEADRLAFVQSKAKALWDNETFQNNSGAGVRGTTRLTNLLLCRRNS